MGSAEARPHRLLAVLHRLFAGWRFPVAVLSVLLFYKLLLLVVLALPVSRTAVGQFAEEFKTWCFGYDPATGRLEPMYVAMMLTEPLVLGGLLVLVWAPQLKEALRRPRQLLPYPVAGLLLVAGGAAAFAGLSEGPATGELPFPAEELRTAYPAPAFQLVDHAGRPTTLEEHRGRVVVLTGVYATCGSTCPMLLGQAKRTVAALTPAERERVSILAVTLDPERDDPAALARLAEGQKVSAPTFRLLTGEPRQVEALLDTLGIARTRNPQTGVIDHANLFLVVDAQGRIAYRFTLGARQEQWLLRSLQLLLQEPPVG